MVKTLEYKGEKIPLRVTYKALSLTRADLGRDFKSTDEAFDYKGAEILCYYAMQVGAEYAGDKLKLQKKDMVDVLDEGDNFHNFIEAYMAFFQAPAKV